MLPESARMFLGERVHGAVDAMKTWTGTRRSYPASAMCEQFQGEQPNNFGKKAPMDGDLCDPCQIRGAEKWQLSTGPFGVPGSQPRPMYCKESIEEAGKYACYPATPPESMIACRAGPTRPDLDWYGGWDVKAFTGKTTLALPMCEAIA
jgi:hypothetical protein